MIAVIETGTGCLLFLAGSCIFSFLNVVIYRLPAGVSFIKGRSRCMSCGHTLSGWDLVPVLSWIFLRGRCRYCGAHVSARYPAVELMGGAAALLSVRRYGCTGAAVAVFALLSLLTVIAFLDADTMEIPNECNALVFLSGLAAAVTMPEPGLLERGIGVLCVSLPMLLIALIVPGGFGGGDIKLMAASGMFLGWKGNLLAAVLGIFLGGAYGMGLLLTKKAGGKDHFAFGPFLCAGIAISLFAGEEILAWYFGFFPQ